MQSQKLAGTKPSVATQKFLDIAEIREGVVIMRDGTLRAVLLVSSINFALKSEEEQEAVISAYVGFLNSLNHPLQIVIQSRKLNIEDYLNRLNESEKGQANELLKIQIADYRNFITELVELGEIMSKRFFVVVPFDPMSGKGKNFFDRVKEVIVPEAAIRLKEERFRRVREELMLRVDHVIGGLASMSIAAAPLDTQGLIELYYDAYNPDIRDSQKISDTGKIRLEE